jgi:hypothetical protein
MMVRNKYSYPKEVQELVGVASGISDSGKILAIAPRSPAERAGLREGDVILSLGPAEMPRGEKFPRAFERAFARHVKEDVPLSIKVYRGGSFLDYVLTPGSVADIQANLIKSDQVNAYASGKNVMVTSRMMEFAKSDSQLGLIIGHEIAHMIMNHQRAKVANQLFGMIVDTASAAFYGVETGRAFEKAASKAYSQEFEIEADHVGLYILALSGSDFREAISLWRDMAASEHSSVYAPLSASHPGAAERFILLGQTAAEVEHKRISRQSIVPEFKKDSWNEQDGVVRIDNGKNWPSLRERDLTPEKVALLAESVFGFTCPEVIGLDSINGQYLVANCSNGIWLKVSIEPEDGRIVIEPLD